MLYKALGAAGGPGGKVGPGTIVGITLAAALIAAAVGLAVHKLRMRHVMQSEIRSIMSQYMPLVSPRCTPSSPCPELHSFESSAIVIWACCLGKACVIAACTCDLMYTAGARWCRRPACVFMHLLLGDVAVRAARTHAVDAQQEGNNLDDALLPGSSPRIKSSAALAKPLSAPPPAEQC